MLYISMTGNPSGITNLISMTTTASTARSVSAKHTDSLNVRCEAQLTPFLPRLWCAAAFFQLVGQQADAVGHSPTAHAVVLEP